MTAPGPTPALVDRGDASRARVRLVAVPFAGTGASAFLPWAPLLPPDILLTVARLPGRENRYREPRRTVMSEVVDELAPAIAASPLPVAVFGYSLGALIGYELALRLQSLDRPPVLLAVGGSNAPQVPRPGRRLSELDDDAFLAAVRELEGTPAEVFEHAELLALVLPTLRADFTLLDGYRPADPPTLRCPVVTYAADRDPELTTAGIAAWADVTTGPTTPRRFAGGHFFFADDPGPLVARLAADVLAAVRE